MKSRLACRRQRLIDNFLLQSKKREQKEILNSGPEHTMAKSRLAQRKRRLTQNFLQRTRCKKTVQKRKSVAPTGKRKRRKTKSKRNTNAFVGECLAMENEGPPAQTKISLKEILKHMERAKPVIDHKESEKDAADLSQYFGKSLYSQVAREAYWDLLKDFVNMSEEDDKVELPLSQLEDTPRYKAEFQSAQFESEILCASGHMKSPWMDENQLPLECPPCVNGEQCFGQVADIKTFGKEDVHATLMQRMTPSEWKHFRTTGDCSKIPKRPCLLCYRHHVSYLATRAQFEQIHIPNTVTLSSNYFNSCNVKGEYKSEYCTQPNPKQYNGITAPVAGSYTKGLCWKYSEARQQWMVDQTEMIFQNEYQRISNKASRIYLPKGQCF